MKRLAFLLFASCALANDTALHDGNDGPAPIGGLHGPESVIRMVREHLDITFGKEKTAVRATFVFLNTKTDAAAHQTVGFPDRTAMAADGTFEADFSGPLENLVTLVDGKERKSRKLRGWVLNRDGIDEPAKAGEKGAFERIWHAIDVEFPVGKEVVIERRYQVRNGSSVASEPEVFFEYTTATGGVWKGTIGELIADIKLTDGLTIDDLLWSGTHGAGVSPAREQWRIEAPNKMQLNWKDFEPRTEPNRRGFRIARPTQPDKE
ncbi:MAG: hypothetical protein QOH88_3661 [Verrucomicrobiota bacterium]|jgi:hypothetical protein